MMFEKYDAYKDSGVEWLRDVPNHWEILRIKSLSLVRRGASPRPIDAPKYFSENGEYAWVRIADVTASNHYLTETKEKLSKLGSSYSVKILPGQLFLSIAGSVGKPIISRIKCCIHDGFVYFPFLKIDNEFLYRVFECGTPFIGLGKHGTQLNLNTETVGNIKIALPPQNEQLAIVNFLDRKALEIDQIIEIKEQQIALLNERKQIVIQKAVTQGLDPNVPMRDSGEEWIGEIPVHWEIRANRTIFKERNEQGKESLPLLSVSIHSGVSNEEIPEEDNIRGRVKIEDKSKYILVKKGDIVFNMMRAWQGGIGAVSLDGMVSPAYIVAKPNDFINSKFFEYQYRCPEFIQQMDCYSKGITDFRKRLYWDGFKQLLTVVPPLDEQLKIVEQIKEIEQQTNFAIQIKNQQIEKLKEYKTTLINDAVTGKIKVA
ncbi:restriction endonuclease subunit S [Acinetobacter calcoaceticus]|uniref:restriction endonuclease subunit S n=1 Tax=Acinetobacter calcoaceticus TaxID=471 RepID=UPI0018DC4546|nr:restriction endonuclease subunit S [Acinetobacter calcoaceticus]